MEKGDNWDSLNGTSDISFTDGTTALNQKAEIVDSSIEKDAYATFTNTRQGQVPTGVILQTAAPAGVGLAVLAGIFALAAKRRKEDEE